MKKVITVIGDVMLDVYHMGRVDRISPEAPIPVFDEISKTMSLGGAANLSANIKSILPDYEVNLVMKNYHCNNDDAYKNFMKLLAEYNIKIFRIGYDEELIRKHRFIDIRNNHQIGLRLDIDKSINKKRINIEKNCLLYHNLCEVILNSEIIVFSDYCKGMFENVTIDDDLISKWIWIISSLYKRDVIKFFLDSRSPSLEKFYGIDYFKPNNKEYDFYIDQSNKLDFKKILNTMSEDGMRLLYNFNGPLREILSIKSMAKNIVDPTGAGDTAMAGLVYGIINDMTDVDSMFLANALSSISCSQFGTYVVKQEDLKNAFKIIEDYKAQNP